MKLIEQLFNLYQENPEAPTRLPKGEEIADLIGFGKALERAEKEYTNVFDYLSEELLEVFYRLHDEWKSLDREEKPLVFEDFAEVKLKEAAECLASETHFYCSNCYSIVEDLHIFVFAGRKYCKNCIKEILNKIDF